MKKVWLNVAMVILCAYEVCAEPAKIAREANTTTCPFKTPTYLDNNKLCVNEGVLDVQHDGKAVDVNGDVKGYVRNGRFEPVIGRNSPPSQPLKFDSSGNAWPMTTEANGNVCYDPQSSFTKGNIPYGFNVPICATGPDDAMLKVKHMLNNACAHGKEELVYLVKSGDRYVIKRGDKGDGDSTSVPSQITINSGEELVATIHNHPELAGQNDSLWPSEMDVVSALRPVRECNAYILDCATGRLAMFNHIDGRVYEIADNGERHRLEKEFSNLVRKNNGHDPYQFENLDRLRREAAEAYLTEVIGLKKQMNEYLRKIVASGRDASKEECKIYNDLTNKFEGKWERIWSEWYHMENKDERKRLGALIDEKMKPYNDEWSDLKTRYEKDRICFNYDGSLAEMVFPKPKLRIPPKPGEVARSLKKTP